MTSIPDITLVCITTRDYGTSIEAIRKTLDQVTPARSILFTDIDITVPDTEVIKISLRSWEDYNTFVVRELYKHITTSHCLIIQHDSWALDGSLWNPEWLQYDFIGAKWNYKDGRNIGNGGFSLRSYKLMEAAATDPAIEIVTPEDEIIGRLYRRYLEKKYDIKFAPEDVADRFSFECHKPIQPTFGFHGFHWQPFRPHILIKRTGAAGDVIMLEPVLEYFHKKGYEVYLETAERFWKYFQNHYFPVHHLSQHDPRVEFERIINLDMAYEVTPKQLVLQSYYNICGIKDGVLRNSKLNFKVTEHNKPFKKYCVIHIDKTAMAHRNIHGVCWGDVQGYLEENGYAVIQVGKADHEPCGLYFNTHNEAILSWVVGGADLFLGSDSGVAQVAVALGVPAVILFQSVNPEYRYANFDKIQVLQGQCEKKETAFCYHNVIGVRGKDCEYNPKTPPCTLYTSEQVIEAVDKLVNKISKPVLQLVK